MNKDFLRGEFPQHAGHTLADLMSNCKRLQHPGDPAPEEDAFLLEKTAHLRKPNETLLAFMGRVGLGPRPLREWKLQRIAEFVAAAERNAADSDVVEPHLIVSQKPKQPGVTYDRKTELDFSTT